MKNQLKFNLLFRFLLLSLFSFLSENILAQSACADWEWVISKTGLKNRKQAYNYDATYNDITTDASGNTFITGEFSDSISFGGIKLNTITKGERQIFVAKLDNKGKWQWAVKVINLSNPYYLVESITTDASGNIYLTGENVNSEFFVTKLGRNGQWKWMANATTRSFHNVGKSEKITSDLYGNIYITGFYEDEANFGNITISASATGSIFSLFIAKIDSIGQWKMATNVDNGDYGYNYNKALITDKSGNILSLNTFYNYSSLDWNIIVSKLDSSGQKMWKSNICSWKPKTESNAFFTNKGISLDQVGNIYLTGNFVDTVNFNGTKLTTKNPKNTDIFVVKLDNNGQWKWVSRAGGKNADSSQAINSNFFGDIYLTGHFSDSISFGSKKLISSGAVGLFVAKIDSTGIWQRVEKVGGSGTFDKVSGNNISLDSAGNIFLFGSFKGSIKFGNKNLTSSAGNTEIFFSKLKGEQKISAGQNQFITCGSTAQLKAGGTGYNTIEWHPKTGLNDPFILNPIASPLKTTTYTITAKNLCGDSVTSKVTVSIKSDINIKGNSTVCPTSVQYYKANADTTINYKWNISGGTILAGQGTDSILVLWGTVGNGNVKLVNTSKYGCKDSTFLSVKIDSSACDWVWPGDANHDKIANSQDVLKIGLAYNDTGAARRNASSSWIAQYADNWTNSFQSGVNYKHADCNGDGIIDSADINVINNNYGQTWKKRGEIQAPAGPNDADLVLEFINDSLQPGDTAYVNVKLGTTIKPATNLYGLAFSFSFDPDLVEEGTMKLKLSNSWLATTGKGLISLVKEFNANGNADIAISRTDKKNASGFGSIGTLSFVIKDHGISKKTLKTEIQNILSISNNEDTIPLNTLGDSIIIYEKESAIQEFAASKNINIYPNPSNGNFILDLKELYAQKIQVINMLGQVIWNTNNVQGKTEIQLNEVSAGLYFINIQTLKGVITKPVIINK